MDSVISVAAVLIGYLRWNGHHYLHQNLTVMIDKGTGSILVQINKIFNATRRLNGISM